MESALRIEDWRASSAVACCRYIAKVGVRKSIFDSIVCLQDLKIGLEIGKIPREEYIFYTFLRKLNGSVMGKCKM